MTRRQSTAGRRREWRQAAPWQMDSDSPLYRVHAAVAALVLVLSSRLLLALLLLLLTRLRLSRPVCERRQSRSPCRHQCRDSSSWCQGASCYVCWHRVQRGVVRVCVCCCSASSGRLRRVAWLQPSQGKRSAPVAASFVAHNQSIDSGTRHIRQSAVRYNNCDAGQGRGALQPQQRCTAAGSRSTVTHSPTSIQRQRHSHSTAKTRCTRSGE